MHLTCPTCSATINTGSAPPGSGGRCPKCSTRIVVPDEPEFALVEEPSATNPFGVPAFDQSTPVRASRGKRRKSVAAGLLLVIVLVSIGGGLAWALTQATAGRELFVQDWGISSLLMLGICAMVMVYFGPSLAAWDRGHRSANAVFALNMLFGWTLRGWILAFIWANTDPDRRR